MNAQRATSTHTLSVPLYEATLSLTIHVAWSLTPSLPPLEELTLTVTQVGRRVLPITQRRARRVKCPTVMVSLPALVSARCRNAVRCAQY